MDINLINKILEYIEEHVEEKLDVKQIASIAGYSDHHFARAFSEFIGTSLKQYINTRKVLHILYESKETKRFIDAAYNYGYEDYSSFYKACKRVYGKSPKVCIETLTIDKPKVFFIGKEKYPMITKQKLKTLLKKWALDKYDIRPMYSENGIARKDHFLVGDYRVIVTNNYNKVLESKRIAEALNDVDIKVPQYIMNVDHKHYAPFEDQYIVVVEDFEQTSYTLTDIKSSSKKREQLGQAIGKLHLALDNMAGFEEDKDAYDTCMNWAMDIVKTIQTEAPIDESFYDEFESYGPTFKALPHQLIHRNPHMHNIFFSEGQISGYGDLHLTTYDIRIFDLCYLCTSILAEDEMEKEVWLKIYKDFIAGYHKISNLTEDEMNAVPYMMYGIQMIFIAYFKTQDGYDGLAQKNYDLLKWMYENLA